VLRQRVVHIAAGRLVPAVAATLSDVDDGLLADSLQPHLAHDLRIDDSGSNGARSWAAPASARAGRSARGSGSEEEVAHRAAAACGA
jgi:hypothetical protein